MKSITASCCYLLVAVIAISCLDREKEVEEYEHPAIYLTLKEAETKRKDFIEGYILNHARYTAYENINLMITYYSHRGEKIGSEEKSFYNRIEPGERGRYSFKIQPPPPPQSETAEINVIILRASPDTR